MKRDPSVLVVFVGLLVFAVLSFIDRLVHIPDFVYILVSGLAILWMFIGTAFKWRMK